MTSERRISWVTCTVCRKRGYASRADGKVVRRRTDPHMAVYECPSGLFHVGHRLPGGASRTVYPSRWVRGDR